MEIEEALIPGFVVEELPDGQYTVVVPSIPTPAAGAVSLMEAPRVHVIDVPFCANVDDGRRPMGLWPPSMLRRRGTSGAITIDVNGANIHAFYHLDECGYRVSLHLFHDSAPVDFDRFLRYAQITGNLFVQQALGDLYANFLFAWSQRSEFTAEFSALGVQGVCNLIAPLSRASRCRSSRAS